MAARKQRWWVVAAVGGAMSLLTMSAGWAAIQLFMFEGAAALSNAELDKLRGGFNLPNVPGVKVSFGFEFDNSIDLPDAAFIATAGTIEFKDPTQASVVISESVDGQVVEVEQKTVDLTKESVRVNVGDPSKAAVTQIIDANAVTTLLNSTVDDATLTSNSTTGITLEGVSELQSKLPAPGVVNTIHSLNYAVTQSLR